MQPEDGYKGLKKLRRKVSSRNYKPENAPKKSRTWPKTGSLEFSNFWLRYRPELDFVLKNINIKINHGEKVGIIGRTGSGKSSLIFSVLRALEGEVGQIFLDGVDTKKVDLKVLRASISILTQVFEI